MALISGSDLARRLDVTPTAVVRARQRGRIAYAEGEKYDAESAAEAFRATSRRPPPKGNGTPAAAPAAGEQAHLAGDGEPPIRSWKDRVDRATAGIRETELACLRGRLLEARSVQVAQVKRESIVRVRLLAVPTRAAALVPPGMQARVAAIVRELIHEALDELANA